MQKIGNDTSIERSVTSHYHGSKISGSQQWRPKAMMTAMHGKENRKKAISLC